MKIELSILLDELAPYRPDNHIKDISRCFVATGIFPSKYTELPTDRIYVGRLSDIMNSRRDSENIYCIACRDRMQDEEENEETLKNILILNSNVDVITIFSRLQTLFIHIAAWQEEMAEAIIKNRPIQDVLCLSERMIGNFITISDSSLGLIAYTTGLDCDCPLTCSLIEKGYHDEKAFEVFRKFRMTESWKNSLDIYINDKFQASPYVNVCRVIHYNNSYFSHVVMICNNRPVTDGLIALFRILVNYLMICFERQWQESNARPQVYESLLVSLVEEENQSPEILNERIKNSGLPLKADFRFIRISTSTGDNVMQQRLKQELQRLIPETRSTILKDSLLVLLVQKSEDNERYKQIYGIVDDALERFNATAGLSNVFYDLTDIRLAYDQASVALRYGSRQSLLPYSGSARLSSPRLFAYESYYPCYLISGTPENARLANSTVASRALHFLDEYDMKHGTNNLELLYVYLSNERKATETAALMHMHRNNVIYRIGRICDMINLDLDNSSVRFRLLLAYEIFSPSETQIK